MTLLCIICAVAAFALFGLATDTHHHQRMHARITPQRKARMRTMAWACVIMSFAPAIMAAGWVFGPVLWCGALMLGAGIVFLWLNLTPVAKE